MANIKVGIEGMIYDGMPLVFRTPCKCDSVEGLTIDYIGIDGIEKSQKFTFVDAHNNDLKSINELFVDDVLVSVILDTTKSRAHIQNADTNAYLESEFSELKNSVGNGKTLVANAITAKGTTTATDATFETMAANIGNIKSIKHVKVSNKYHNDTYTVNLGMYPDVLIIKVERYDDNTMYYYAAWAKEVGWIKNFDGCANYREPTTDGKIQHIGASSVSSMKKYYNDYFWCFKF